MLNSLELNWLRNEDKTLPLPQVVFAPLTTIQGEYFFPSRSELYLGGRFYDRRHGVIVVSTIHPDYIPSIIAHEWRHHWQEFHGWHYDGIGWQHTNELSRYERNIRAYFTRSRCEADALRFELRRAPCEVNDYWRGLLSAPLARVLP